MSDKGLTPAEIKVLRTYCEKETHAEAAAVLGISVQTLKNHLGSIYRKTGARKAHSAVYRLCMANGFNPFDITATSRDGSVVISVGTKEDTQPVEKAPESPASDPIKAEEGHISGDETQL